MDLSKWYKRDTANKSTKTILMVTKVNFCYFMMVATVKLSSSACFHALGHMRAVVDKGDGDERDKWDGT